jgi:hypothetical protein
MTTLVQTRQVLIGPYRAAYAQLPPRDFGDGPSLEEEMQGGERLIYLLLEKFGDEAAMQFLEEAINNVRSAHS